MGIRREDIDNYYKMTGEGKEFSLETVTETLMFELYKGYNRHQLDMLDKVLSVYTQRVYGIKDRYISMKIEKFRDREDYQKIELGLNWDGIYGVVLQKGVENQLKNVTPEDMYKYFQYAIKREIVDSLHIIEDLLGGIKIGEEGIKVDSGMAKRMYKDSAKGMYHKVDYFCGHERAYELMVNYTNEYFKEVEDAFGVKVGRLERLVLENSLRLRWERIRLHYKKDELKGITNSVYG